MGGATFVLLRRSAGVSHHGTKRAVQQRHLFDVKLFVAERLLKGRQLQSQHRMGVPFFDGDGRADHVADHARAKLDRAKLVRVHRDTHFAVPGGIHQLGAVDEMVCRNVRGFGKWKRRGRGSRSVLMRGGTGAGRTIGGCRWRVRNDGCHGCRQRRAIRLACQTNWK